MTVGSRAADDPGGALAFATEPMPTPRNGQPWSRYRLLPLRLTQADTPARVVVPAPRAHVVVSGDSLWRISRAYDVNPDVLRSFNSLASDRLTPGQVLRVPNGPSAVRTAPAAATRALMKRANARFAFAWPARGVLTSRFGTRWRRHHAGIDLAAPRGTPILAAGDGVVQHAGWMSGYGKLVVVEHADGKESYYGHASAVYVRAGETVKRGRRVAAVGCTGACTGAHLHFEIRVAGRPVDPLPYLR